MVFVDADSGFDQIYASSQSLRRPVFSSGGARNWTPVQKWDVPYLLSKAGGGAIRAYRETGAGDWYKNTPERSGKDSVEGALGHVAKLLTDAPARYYAGEIPLADFPQLHEELGLARALGPILLNAPVPESSVLARLWLGRASKTQLHYDLFHTILVVTQGWKEVHLYPPLELERFYPFSLPELLTSSRVQDPTGDLAQFPLFPAESGRVVLVKPGDLLFIPAFWWHFVKSSEEMTVTVTVHFTEYDDYIFDSTYFANASRADAAAG